MTEQDRPEGEAVEDEEGKAAKVVAVAAGTGAAPGEAVCVRNAAPKPSINKVFPVVKCAVQSATVL